jgi:hypothetical protein
VKVYGFTVKVVAAEILVKKILDNGPEFCNELKLSEVYQAPRVSSLYSSLEDHKKRHDSL